MPALWQTSSVRVYRLYRYSNLIPTGTGLILCIEDNGATFSVRIDGHESTTDALYNEACIYQGASRAISFENQNFQSHRLEVNIAHASSKHEFQFFGAVIQTRIALLRYSMVLIHIIKG